MNDNNEQCPVLETMRLINKKWHLNIIRDLFFGKTKFTEFKKENPKITNKVLSDTLKDLESNELIEKVNSEDNFKLTEYRLTAKGLKLNKIIYELGMFSIENRDSSLKEKENSIQFLKSHLDID